MTSLLLNPRSVDTRFRNMLAMDGPDLAHARRAAGEFALHMFHLRGLPMPGQTEFGNIIERAVERMSPAERASGTLSADVIGSINSAVTQVTRHDRPINITSAEAAQLAQNPRYHGYGTEGDRLLALAARRSSAEGGYSDLRAAGGVTEFSRMTEATYSGSPFERAGLSYGVFHSLRSQGFDQTQIIAAARFGNELGVNVNRHAATIAKIQRDIPSAAKGLVTTRDGWRAIGELERQKREAEEKGDTAHAADLGRKIEADRRRMEDHDRRERERVERERPELAPGHRELQRDVREEMLKRGLEARREHDTSPPDISAQLTEGQRATRAERTQTVHMRGEDRTADDRRAIDRRDQDLLADTPPQPRPAAEQRPTEQQVKAQATPPRTVSPSVRA